MAERESRRPGEKWFEHYERTTHPHAQMNKLGTGCTCCPQREPEPVPARTRQQILDLVYNPFRKEQP